MTASPTASRSPTSIHSDWPRIGDYLLLRLKEAGVDHCFGVPGD